MKRSLLVLVLAALWLMMSVGLPIVSAAPVAQSGGLTSAEINEIATKIVYIEAEENGQPFASGSGTLVNSSGLIYTNRHVVEGGDDFHIYLVEDMRELPTPRYYASVVFVSDEIDFAILQIDRDNRGRSLDSQELDLPFLEETTNEINYGDPIYIFGFPDIGDGYLVLTQGSITTIENGDIGGDRLPVWYRTDAEMSSGNSGGMVVNAKGEYVGIPTWVRKADQTLGQLGGILPFPAIDAVLGGFDPQSDNLTFENPNGGGGGGGSDVFTVTIENTSRDEICYIYFSPTTSTEWGGDKLGSEETLNRDDAVEFEAEAGKYDLLLQDCDKESLADQRDIILQDDLVLTYDNGEILNVPEPDTREAEPELLLEIQSIEENFVLEGQDEEGLMVYTYIRATGYKDVPLRVALFYYDEDDQPLSAENALEENQSPSGFLTIQTVVQPEYDDTEWDGFWFWMPYSSFPDQTRRRVTATVQAQIGEDGGEFTTFSDFVEFDIVRR